MKRLASTATRSTLTVAILGSSADAQDWVEALAGRSEEILQPRDIDELFAAAPDLAIVATHPEGAVAVIERCLGAEAAPALTLLVGRGTAGHPHTRLVRAVIAAKRDWERTFDAIDDPIAILDGNGAIRRANTAFARLADRSVRDVIGVAYRDALGQPPDAPGGPIGESLDDAQPRTREVEYGERLGTQLVTIFPFGEAQDRQLLVIMKDVSAMKEQRELLYQAARLADIEQLAGGVAHEINTPLASISLRAESLERAAQDPRLTAIDSFKNFPRYLKTIQEETFRCKRIISALLEFARSREPKVEDVDLNGTCRRAADLLAHELKLKGIELQLDLAEDLPKIEADEHRLSQAWVALLMNALDFTPESGHVRIETRRVAGALDRIQLSISDDGPGIPPEDLDKVFQPFFTTRPTGEGTGLGLAICHGIVAAHGGAIWVESRPGQGARFVSELPVSRARRAGSEPDATS